MDANVIVILVYLVVGFACVAFLVLQGVIDQCTPIEDKIMKILLVIVCWPLEQKFRELALRFVCIFVLFVFSVCIDLLVLCVLSLVVILLYGTMLEAVSQLWSVFEVQGAKSVSLWQYVDVTPNVLLYTSLGTVVCWLAGKVKGNIPGGMLEDAGEIILMLGGYLASGVAGGIVGFVVWQVSDLELSIYFPRRYKRIGSFKGVLSEFCRTEFVYRLPFAILWCVSVYVLELIRKNNIDVIDDCIYLSVVSGVCFYLLFWILPKNSQLGWNESFDKKFEFNAIVSKSLKKMFIGFKEKSPVVFFALCGVVGMINYKLVFSIVLGKVAGVILSCFTW